MHLRRQPLQTLSITTHAMHAPSHLVQLLAFLAICVSAGVLGAQSWKPCAEINTALRLPCRCRAEQYGATGGVGSPTVSVAMDCDRVVFHGEYPPIPHGTPVVTYTQRHSGQQFIPTQAFGVARIPIRSLDFSHNAIRRLSEKLFVGVHDTLIVLRLADNLLGDSLNPIFSTAELHPLGQLKVLDLAGNKLRDIEEGLLKGCEQLQELYLDRNSFLGVPAKSLNGPRALKILSMQHNSIVHLNVDQFGTQRQLERIDLRHNLVSIIDGATFQGLTRIKEILLAGNRLARFNSDVFQGAATLQKLDLSQNFISIFPNIALRSIEHVKVLNLSANLIQQVGASNFEEIRGLQILDLSRNNIASVPPATFRSLKALKYLDLSLNSLRTIEDDALEGLDSLQTLIIRDNNILLIPGSALGRLPRLANLYLDFNRVAALSADILGSIQPEDIKYMSLSRNVIRELPPDSFQKFQNLIYLDLSGNSLANVNSDTFSGLEQSLRELRLAQNRITSIGQVPLALGELKFLDLSENNIGDLPRNIFRGLDNLVSLNLSGNSHMGSVPATLLHPLGKLRVLDLSDTGMKVLSDELFVNSPALEQIRLSHNGLQEIREASFANLRNITAIDLSYNSINSMRSSAFINLMNIKRLNLRGNQLSIFKGEYFNTGTGLEVLDISDNDLSYLFPSSFRIHPRLRRIEAANNKFTFFPAELIVSLQFLEHIDLSGNLLKIIDELDFARLPHLRTLLVARNELETLNEMAFHNSSQLQHIDLSDNRLDRVGERTFEGLVRIELLNLEGNRLAELPDSIFERNKLQSLENINLAHNRFEMAPLRSLQKQFFFVSAVDLSHNQIRHLPVEDSAIVNIKKLDLSYNPLTADSLRNILSEPKTIRELNLAGTGLRQITALETPFLQVLNVSHNDIVEVNEISFSRTTLLETLDLSSNRLVDMRALAKVWPMLGALQHLDISNNSIELIAQGDFDSLEMLRTLSLTDLSQCSRIERNAFKNLPALTQLRAYDFAKLGYLDVQGIVELLPALDVLDIEIKDAVVGSDQIQILKHPRLTELGIRGSRLRSISSGTLAGLKTSNLKIKLLNTSLSSLPPALLFPIPRSARLELDITHSGITVLSPQLLAAIDDRRASLSLRGLDTNPITCDCNARALRRWLPGSGMADLKCSAPDYLAGKLLIEVADDELTCDSLQVRKENAVAAAAAAAAKVAQQTVAIVPTRTSTSKFVRSTTVEPEIIWSMPPTPVKIKTKSPLMKPHPVMTNDDTLIIGIVAGVVAFIIIIIIIFCIVRLRMSNDDYRTTRGAGHMGMPGRMPPNAMGYSGGGGKSGAATNATAATSTIYAVPPYAQSYATLQTKGQVGLAHQQQLHHQSQQSLAQLRQQYSTLGRMPYYQQQQQQQQQQLQQQQQQHQQHQHQQMSSANGQPYIIYGDEKSYR